MTEFLHSAAPCRANWREELRQEHGDLQIEKIKRAKRAAMAAHPHTELIDLGVGEPDEMALPMSVRALCEEAQKPENRGYADNGGRSTGGRRRIDVQSFAACRASTRRPTSSTASQ